MTSLVPIPVTGHVVPGDPTPLRRKWITNEPYGPPIKEQPVVEPSTGQPKKHGDEQHNEVMGQLQKIIVKQQATQMQDALPGFRDWRLLFSPYIKDG